MFHFYHLFLPGQYCTLTIFRHMDHCLKLKEGDLHVHVCIVLLCVIIGRCPLFFNELATFAGVIQLYMASY